MNKQKSFTLIELLVVIVIIGILAGVIMISTSSSIDKANFAKAQAFSSTIQEELLSNLVSEWTFDEGSNQTVNRIATDDDVKDTWGSNNGTVYGNPQIKGGSDCVFGKCMSFDGDGDNIIIPNNENISFGIKNFSVTFWIYANDKINTSIIAKGRGNWDNPDVKSFNINLYTKQRLEYVIDDSVNTVRKQSFKNVDSVWHYAVFSFDRDGLGIIYIDGSKDAFISISSVKDITSGENLYIGSRQDGYNFDGLIDDVRIYSEALSSSQIKQNYISGLNSMLANGNISKQEHNERINTLAKDDY